MTAQIVDRKIFNVGVVGVGHMGRYHVNLLAKIFPSDNIFIFDTNRENCDKVAEQYEVNACFSYEELLSNVEAVVIVVPTFLHYEYTVKALDAGCHVLVEKPISNSLTHAYEMVRYAEEKGLVLHVGYVERFNGAIQEIRNLIEEPFYFQTQRLGSVSRIQDVGVVLDLMIHDIDIILSFANSKVKEISAYGKRVYSKFEDYAVATLHFENGITATLTASRVSSYKARSMVVSQKHSYLSLDYASNDLVVYRNPDSTYDVSQKEIKYRQEQLIDRIFVHQDNPLKTELEYFIDTINKEENICNKYSHILWDSLSNLYTMEIAFRILAEIERNY